MLSLNVRPAAYRIFATVGASAGTAHVLCTIPMMASLRPPLEVSYQAEFAGRIDLCVPS
ncbi:hypothetical protein HYDPIDRAFT_108396 [Hydnomerulius pinastri MD-312]|nr:hypothetical protein HYDPIDRAFT_108396 [Hydnomerulius pinastri MD-312]